MALITINKNPEPRELRQFGLLFFPAFMAMIAWITYRVTGQWTIPGICLGLAGLAFLLGALAPAAIRPIWIVTMYLTFPIGFVISHVLMAIVYYLILTPAGLLLRLFKGDPLQRKADPTATTYWKLYGS